MTTDWKLLSTVQLCVVVKKCGQKNKKYKINNSEERRARVSCGSSPTSVLCQHRRCMVETCCVLGFNKLFVRHTTSPKISPSARWPSSLNPQPGHLTAYVLEIILIIIPASTSSRHVRIWGGKKPHTIRALSVFVFFSFFFLSIKAPDCFAVGCGRGGEKSTKGGGRCCATRLAWPGLTGQN